MRTCVPTEAELGEKPVMVGGGTGMTLKFVGLAAMPPGATTTTGPLVAAIGTVAVICVSASTVKAEAGTPLNVTAVAPVKFVPVMTTDVLTVRLPGARPVMVGA